MQLRDAAHELGQRRQTAVAELAVARGETAAATQAVQQLQDHIARLTGTARHLLLQLQQQQQQLDTPTSAQVRVRTAESSHSHSSMLTDTLQQSTGDMCAVGAG